MACTPPLRQLGSCILGQTRAYLDFSSVNWYEEARTIGTACLLALIIILAINYIPFHHLNDTLTSCLSPHLIYLRDKLPPRIKKLFIYPPPPPGRMGIGARIIRPYKPPPQPRLSPPYRRIYYEGSLMDIYGYPSSGGVIILQDVSFVDFQFLGLDFLGGDGEIEERGLRCGDKREEDEFCQSMLRLGARWWDDYARFVMVSGWERDVRDDGDGWVGRGMRPTVRESSWVRVGWERGGGLWVGEVDGSVGGPDYKKDGEEEEEEEEEEQEEEDEKDVYHKKLEEGKKFEENLGWLRMARTMDERCQILRKRFGAKFYGKVEDYDGNGFLNRWSLKEWGEVGPLIRLEDLDSSDSEVEESTYVTDI